jgi:hypothetical protein
MAEHKRTYGDHRKRKHLRDAERRLEIQRKKREQKRRKRDTPEFDTVDLPPIE